MKKILTQLSALTMFFLILKRKPVHDNSVVQRTPEVKASEGKKPQRAKRKSYENMSHDELIARSAEIVNRIAAAQGIEPLPSLAGELESAARWLQMVLSEHRSNNLRIEFVTKARRRVLWMLYTIESYKKSYLDYKLF